MNRPFPVVWRHSRSHRRVRGSGRLHGQSRELTRSKTRSRNSAEAVATIKLTKAVLCIQLGSSHYDGCPMRTGVLGACLGTPTACTHFQKVVSHPYRGQVGGGVKDAQVGRRDRISPAEEEVSANEDAF